MKIYLLWFCSFCNKHQQFLVDKRTNAEAECSVCGYRAMLY